MWPKKPFFFARPDDKAAVPGIGEGAVGTMGAVNHEKTLNQVEVADDSSIEKPNDDAQTGVKRVEAITVVWSKRSLYLTYAFIWLVYFINSFQSQITGNLTAFVVSDFSLHSLIPAIAIVNGILSGIIQLPLAKTLDLWGRAEGFAMMVTLATLGLIMMAACKNVETYAAAQVFYTVGFSGINYILEIVVADTSSLRNRSLAFAFQTSPYIATAFAGPKAAEGFYTNISWRWAFGTFAILVPVLCFPNWYILWYNQRKAKKQGLLNREPSGRTSLQSIWHYTIEFDALGVFLISAGLVLLLLPFSLAGYEKDKWQTGYIIAMIVLGFVLLVIFGLYEKFVAPTPFIPFHLLWNRTVLGACLLSGTLFVAYYCWDGYYSSYLQVVHGLSISQAGYVGNIYSVGSCLVAIADGWLIILTGKFKWLAWIALPVQLLGGGLMIHFRQPNTDVGYIVMCQIFIALAGGTLVIAEQMAVMAVCEHSDVAALLALLALFAYVGGAVGSSISGAIWTNTLYEQLVQRLPAEYLDQAADIYSDLDMQLSFPIGSPTRIAIQQAYGVAQKRMTIAGTCILVLSFVWVALWRDVKVSDIKQVKGRVF